MTNSGVFALKMDKASLKRNRKYGRGKPKRLIILKKSKHMRKWLVRNPWISPMSVFNYAAVKIQQYFRGHLRRRLNKTKGIKRKGSSRLKSKNNQQLDKYLTYLDKCKSKLKQKPLWLDGGYSTWCAVKIQSIFRMRKVYVRYRRSKQLISQVASIVIQTAWRNHVYYKSMRKEEPKVRTPFTAARAIQLKWRSYCNRRIFKYFCELIKNKLKGAPYDLLRTIIPNEADLLDRACGAHVRFRLGGWIFPPKVYFKIYTHRPLCDVGSFAPRDYRSEKKVDDKLVHNKLLGHLDYTNRSNKLDTMRVGTRYFDTIVSTTSAEGTSNWYKRDENNNWRAISTQLFENILAPPWYREAGHKSKPKQFHFSSLTRQKEIKLQKQKKQREWLVKAFLLAGAKEEGRGEDDNGFGADGSQFNDDYELDGRAESKYDDDNSRSRQDKKSSTEYEDKHAFGADVANSDILNELFYLNKKINTQNDKRLQEAKETPHYPNGHFKPMNLLRSSNQSNDLKHHNHHILSPKERNSPHGRNIDFFHKEPVAATMTTTATTRKVGSGGVSRTSNPSSGNNSLARNESYQKLKADMAASDKKYVSRRAPEEQQVDLIDWSQALNYDEYCNTWSNLGTSMPSDVNHDAMYHLAATTNKDLRIKFYGNSTVPYN